MIHAVKTAKIFRNAVELIIKIIPHPAPSGKLANTLLRIFQFSLRPDRASFSGGGPVIGC